MVVSALRMWATTRGHLTMMSIKGQWKTASKLNGMAFGQKEFYGRKRVRFSEASMATGKREWTGMTRYDTMGHHGRA
jgi:hypothetical protein